MTDGRVIIVTRRTSIGASFFANRLQVRTGGFALRSAQRWR
jgi:hypothetical protein